MGVPGENIFTKTEVFSMKNYNDAALWWNEGAFLYVGRMGANKGVENIIHAWMTLHNKIHDQCPDLWIVGGSPSEITNIRQNIYDKEMLLQLENRGRIRWWGYLDSKGISSLLLKTRVLLMHSAYEPGGRVVLEALSQGVPVIATPHGFALDLVRDWATGFLVPHGNTDMLLHRMEHFARQPLLGCSMGYAAKATAKAALSSWSFYKQHADIYSETQWLSTPPALSKKYEIFDVIYNELPRCLIGRYPFAVDFPNTSDIRTFAVNELNLSSDNLTVKSIRAPGHSLLWRITYDNTEWLAQHAYTIFINRPLWDRAYGGSIFKEGAKRRMRKKTSSLYSGFVPIEKEDITLGIQISLYYPNAFSGITGLDRASVGKKAINLIAQEPVSTKEANSLKALAHNWWKNREECPWITEAEDANLLRKKSLRIAWPELISKISQKQILIPESFINDIFSICSKVDSLVESEVSAKICMQHGDLSPHHLVKTPNGLRLLDGESVGLGWKGRDEAYVIIKCRDASLSMQTWLNGSLNILCESSFEKGLSLIWILIEAVNQLARLQMLHPDKFDEDLFIWFQTVLFKLNLYLSKFNL